jgi:hypothetical protein
MTSTINWGASRHPLKRPKRPAMGHAGRETTLSTPAERLPAILGGYPPSPRMPSSARLRRRSMGRSEALAPGKPVTLYREPS